MNNTLVSVMWIGSPPELNGLLLGTVLQLFLMEPAVVIWADDGRAKGNVTFLCWGGKKNCASFLHQEGNETSVCSSFSLTARVESHCRDGSRPLSLSCWSFLCSVTHSQLKSCLLKPHGKVLPTLPSPVPQPLHPSCSLHSLSFAHSYSPFPPCLSGCLPVSVRVSAKGNAFQL